MSGRKLTFEGAKRAIVRLTRRCAEYDEALGREVARRELAEIQQDALAALVNTQIPIRLWCPDCGRLHVDEGEWATKPHHTHACQYCGAVWRPAVVATVGVRFLPGFKNPGLSNTQYRISLAGGEEKAAIRNG